VTRAILVEAPPVLPELRVLNRSYAHYDRCAELVLLTWLRRNLELQLLGPALEKLPLSSEALELVAGAAAERCFSAELRFRAGPEALTVNATDFYIVHEGEGVRLFGMAMTLGPNPLHAGWTQQTSLPGFQVVLLAARPCAETTTLWHMVAMLRAKEQPIASAVAGCPPALTAVSPPGPVYKVRKERGMPANLACCRYGVFAGGAAAVRQRVDDLCDDCGDCDIEDLASGGRRPPLLREPVSGEVRLRCCTNEGLEDGEVLAMPTGAEWPTELGAAALPPAVLRHLAHDTPLLQEARAYRALEKLCEAAAELAQVLRGVEL
jgi:hypothetical protein